LTQEKIIYITIGIICCVQSFLNFLTMSTFGKATFKAAGYLSARPTYPKSLYDYIYQYNRKHNGSETSSTLCIDIGCGPGEATRDLGKYFDSVVGVEPSQVMIEAGNNARPDSGEKTNIQFVRGDDTSFESLFPAKSVDVIASAQAAHWFKYPDFLDAAHRVLKPNGTLAIWGYVDHVFVGHPEASRISLEYAYGNSHMGPYWEQVGRNRLRAMYAETVGPLKDNFFDIEKFDNTNLDLTPGEVFEMSKTTSLRNVKDYMKTSSAYHNWKHDHPQDPDVADECFEAIKSAERWTDSTEVTIKWNTVLLLATNNRH
jgi:SAM-dependent methyltransferase